MKKTNVIFIVLFVVLASAFAIWQFKKEEKSISESVENSADIKGEIIVYKDKYCGCCGLWADAFKKKGYSVKEVEVRDMTKIKTEKSVPLELASCHTAVLDDKYILEGHVPLESVEKLQNEKPDILGIAVPGMPTGVPGMPGAPSFDELEIYSFDKDGSKDIFEKRKAGEIEL